MKRTLLTLILTLMVGALPLLAKPGVPLQFKLECSAKENLGEITRYTVELTVTPLAESDRVSLDVKVPEGYRLLNGFKYWEGKVVSRSTFKEKLTLDGPTSSPLDLEVKSTLHMGKAVSSKSLKLLLAPQESTDEVVYPQLDLQVEKTGKSEGRRIRRE
jgi:hypothetical protein